MKILMVSNRFGANAVGGAERVIEAEARALLLARHEVAVIRFDEVGGTEGIENGVRTMRFRPRQPFPFSQLARRSWLSRLYWHLHDVMGRRSARDLAELIEREQPDVVHTHNLTGLGWRLPAELRRRGIRQVHTVHDVQLIHPSGLIDAAADPLKLNWFERLYVGLMRRRIGSPAVVLFPSQYLFSLHDRLGFFRTSWTYVLPNPAPEPARVREIAPSPLTMMFVGQLELHKGIIDLVGAWEDWNGRAVLEIAGTGSLESRLRQMVLNHPTVRLLGHLDRGALTEAYRRTTFLVVPSLVIENSPAVIGEAFAAGVPVIAAACGGIPEMVIDDRTGFLFKPDDQDSLRDALSRAARSYEEGNWPKLSRYCLTAAEHVTTTKHLERLVEAYGGRRLT